MLNFFRKKEQNNIPVESKKSRRYSMRSFLKHLSFGGGLHSTTKEADIPTAHICGLSLIASLGDKTLKQARPMAIKNPVAKGYLQTLQRNVIGHKGITLQARVKNKAGKSDKKINDMIEKSWQRFCKKGNCDVTGILSFRGIQKQAVVCLSRDGNFFARIVYKDNQMLIQHLDAQLLATTYYDNFKNIFGGIEIDNYGKPISYYFHKTDMPYNNTEMMRIPASEIIHIFEQDLPGQLSGLSWFTSVIFTLHNIKDMNDSTLRKARVASNVQSFLKYNSDVDASSLDEDSAINEFQIDDISFGVLPVGMEQDKVEFNFPGNEYAPYVKTNLRQASSGLGVSYNNLASDAESVNFSSIRHFALQERDVYKDIQEIIIESLCVPIFEKWINFVVLSGKLKVGNYAKEDIERLYEVDFVGRRWEWIDPLKDAKASQLMMQSMLKSPGQIITENGGDKETVFASYGEDIKMMQEAGIPDDIIQKAIFDKIIPNTQTTQTQDKQKQGQDMNDAEV